MRTRQTVLLFFLIFCPVFITAANILALAGLSSPSHHNWNRHIYYKLAAAGHNLTVFSADVDREVTPGVHYIWAESVYSSLANGSLSFSLVDMVVNNPLLSSVMVYSFYEMICPAYHNTKGFQTLLNYPNDFKFDLALVDYTAEPCLIGFLDKFNSPPTVGMSAFSVPPYTYEFAGGHVQPSFVPFYGTAYTNKELSFMERLENFCLYIVDNLYRQFVFIPRMEKQMQTNFKNTNLNAFNLLKKINLALVNTHFSLENVEPLPPNVIPVGGLQIQDPKPLETELEEFIQNGKNGAVLFSLGTNMKSEFMDDDRRQMFIDAFEQLPDYNFIWKYEAHLNIQLPKNVKTLGWVRQNDILAHPKIKAFISHCGQLGTQEAAWYGIPVVGVPFFADQHRNVGTGIREGTSVKVDFVKLSVEAIKSALIEILSNPKYLQNAQRRSRLFRDQPQKPIERAHFWIEWLLRHSNDFSSIQSPIKNLGVIVSNSYDVIAFLFVIIVLIQLSLLWIILKCWKKRRHVKNKMKKQ